MKDRHEKNFILPDFSKPPPPLQLTSLSPVRTSSNITSSNINNDNHVKSSGSNYTPPSNFYRHHPYGYGQYRNFSGYGRGGLWSWRWPSWPGSRFRHSYPFTPYLSTSSGVEPKTQHWNNYRPRHLGNYFQYQEYHGRGKDHGRGEDQVKKTPSLTVSNSHTPLNYYDKNSNLDQPSYPGYINFKDKWSTPPPISQKLGTDDVNLQVQNLTMTISPVEQKQQCHALPNHGFASNPKPQLPDPRPRSLLLNTRPPPLLPNPRPPPLLPDPVPRSNSITNLQSESSFSRDPRLNRARGKGYRESEGRGKCRGGGPGFNTQFRFAEVDGSPGDIYSPLVIDLSQSNVDEQKSFVREEEDNPPDPSLSVSEKKAEDIKITQSSKPTTSDLIIKGMYDWTDVRPPSPLSPEFTKLYNEDLVESIKESELEKHEQMADKIRYNKLVNLTIQLGQVSSELKTARSMVRSCEISSTSKELRRLYLQEQREYLEKSLLGPI